jgi:hypothetical protein
MPPSDAIEDWRAEQLDLARRILRSEQQLAAYQELHTAELDELHDVLTDCKKQLLRWLPAQGRDSSPDPESAAGAARPAPQA